MHGRRDHVQDDLVDDNSEENSSESAGTNLDEADLDSDEEMDSDDEDDSLQQNSFVANDDEPLDAPGNRLNYAALLNEQEQRDRQREFERRPREQILDEDLGEDVVRVADADPDVYRVSVRRGQAERCCLEMARFVFDANYKYERGLAKYCFKISAITAPDNDPEAVYIESTQPAHVEMLAGQPRFKNMVSPFKRAFLPQPVTKRAQLLREIHKLDRKDEQVEVFQRVHESELKIEPRQYYYARRIKLGRKARTNVLVRVLEADPRRGVATVVLLSPYRSLVNHEEAEPRRFTREDYEETGEADKYDKETTFQSGTYLQGLLVADVQYEQLRDVTAQDTPDKPSLYLSGDSAETILASAPRNAELRKLSMGDFVLLTAAYPDRPLQGVRCEVIRVMTDYTYAVRVADPEHPELKGRELSPVERFHMTKWLAKQAHVAILSRDETTGTVVVTRMNSEQTQLLLTVKVDVVGTVLTDVKADDCELRDSVFRSRTEVRLGEKVFRQFFQLVRTPAGEDAIVTFLHDSRAKVLTADNRELVVDLADLQPVYQKRQCDMVQDGSSPSQVVGLKSEVRWRGQSGTVVQISQQQAGAQLFVRFSQVCKAVPAREVTRVHAGPIVQKNTRANAQQLTGMEVQITNPSYMGARGKVVSQNGDKFTIQLADRRVDVDCQFVRVFDEHDLDRENDARITAQTQVPVGAVYTQQTQANFGEEREVDLDEIAGLGWDQ